MEEWPAKLQARGVTVPLRLSQKASRLPSRLGLAFLSVSCAHLKFQLVSAGPRLSPTLFSLLSRLQRPIGPKERRADSILSWR